MVWFKMFAYQTPNVLCWAENSGTIILGKYKPIISWKENTTSQQGIKYCCDVDALSITIGSVLLWWEVLLRLQHWLYGYVTDCKQVSIPWIFYKWWQMISDYSLIYHQYSIIFMFNRMVFACTISFQLNNIYPLIFKS